MRDPHGFRPLVARPSAKDASVVASRDVRVRPDRRRLRARRRARRDRASSRRAASTSHRFAARVATPLRLRARLLRAARLAASSAAASSARAQGFGRRLAREHPAEADVVIPVPDSGVPRRSATREESGIPFELGLIRSHYVGRTFIEPQAVDPPLRRASLKLSPVREVVEGKRIVVVDDSLVRGTTSRKIVKMLRDAGAREVHLRISAPPTTHPCFYGIDTPTRERADRRHPVGRRDPPVHRRDTLGYLSHRGHARRVRAAPAGDLLGLLHRQLPRRDRGRGAREGARARREVGSARHQRTTAAPPPRAARDVTGSPDGGAGIGPTGARVAALVAKALSGKRRRFSSAWRRRSRCISCADHPVARSHDEAAYLLQAEIFASGRWAAPSPPLPEFFEQYHVLVTPVLAAKYPPGNSLLLAPGAAVGAPALTPILCLGIAGGFLFLLARRFSNVWVASWAWLLWTSAPATLHYLCGYLSENVTLALWLVGWWGLANWREKGGAGWLSVFATAVAWGALTRPLTALAYAATGGVFVVLELARRRRPWRDLALACVPALAILSLPSDLDSEHDRVGRGPVPRLGSELPSGRPARRHRHDFRRARTAASAGHAGFAGGLHGHPRPGTGPRRSSRSPSGRCPDRPRFLGRLAGAPRGALSDRPLRSSEGGPFRRGDGPAALRVAPRLCPRSRVVDLLDVEAQPALAWVTAAGGVAATALARRRIDDAPSGAVVGTGPALASIALAVVALAPVTAAVAAARIQVDEWSVYHDHFRAELAAIPEPRAIVFVRYGPHHVVDMSLVRNSPDLTRAPVWIVYDRGQDNARLLRAAPGRAPYLYDAVTGTLAPWSADVAP